MQKPLEIVHPDAAGIDIGSRSFFVDAGEDVVKIFPTYTEGCHALKDYLLSNGIKTVAMESTGVYWVILYAVLEEAGIDVFLVNGRDVRNVPGRKSDVKDCQWLRQLHAYGLLRKSFIPPAEIRSLRSYVRLRQDHIRSSTTQIHLMQKALTQMNIRLAEVINDITGASGIKMIQSILEGETNPKVLINLCHTSILKTKKELVLKALEGEYKKEHLFALKQAYHTWEYFNNLIDECDKEIEKLLTEITKDQPNVQTNNKRKPIRYHKPAVKDLHVPLLKLSSGKDPSNIAGLTDYTFLQLVSEVGVDLTNWKSEKHFASWLKLSPQKSSSGAFVKRVKVKHHNKASLIFRNAAQGLLTSKKIALGEFGRRISSKRGPAVAIKAVARKLACYYYRVMTQGEQFLEKGIEAYKEHLNQKKKRYLEKLALDFNMCLVPNE